MRAAARLTAALAGVFALLVAQAQAQAPEPRNGPIAFTAFNLEGSFPQIRTLANAQTTCGVNLTYPAENMNAFAPAFSPDGERFAFYGRAAEGSESFDIFTKRSDGTDLQQLTDDGFPDHNPDYGPGGEVVYTSNHATETESDIYSTASAEPLLATEAYETDPSISADGSLLAYLWENHEVRVHDLSGGGDTPIADGDHPDISPDGSKVAYSTDAGIRVELADGTGEPVVISTEEDDIYPTWSPDGRWIAFSHNLIDPNGIFAPERDIFIARANGSGEPERHTFCITDESWPAWQPLPPDETAPQTKITKAPPKKTRKAAVRFAFKATDESPVTFRCSLDGGGWKGCKSPKKLRVKPGKHTFRVRATDSAGNVDASPAAHTWTARKPKR